MGHYLKTMNPEAADAIGKEGWNVPHPYVSQPVQFYLQGGQFRAGKNVFAAVVMKVYDDPNLADLLIFQGADDFLGKQGVPRRTQDGEMGWVATSGQQNAPDDTERMGIAKALATLESRLGALETEVFPPPVQIKPRAKAKA